MSDSGDFPPPPSGFNQRPGAPAGGQGGFGGVGLPVQSPAAASPPMSGRVGFWEAIRRGFAQYATFGTRAHRSEYWYWVLFSVLVANVATRSDLALGWSSYDAVTGDYGPGHITQMVGIALFVPGLAVAVRRMHDTDTSGHYLWWLLLPIVGLIMVIVRLCQPGIPGPNRYGEPA